MQKTARNILLGFAAVALSAAMTYAQVSFSISLTVTNGSNSQILKVGVNPGNTIGTDTSSALGDYQESPAPPAPPAPFDFDARLVTPPGHTTTFPVGLGGGVYADYRGYTSSTQIDTFSVQVNGDSVEFGQTTISWPSGLSSYGTSWTIKPYTGSSFSATSMLSGTSITFAAGQQPLKVLIIKVGAFAPSPGPTFAVDKSSIAFGTVAVNATKIDSFVVSNTGNSNAMSLKSITLPGTAFVVSPTLSYPVSIAAGASQKFYVAFTPTSGAAYSDSISFKHDTVSAAEVIKLSGTGLAQGGTLSFSQSSVRRLDNTAGYKDSLGLTLTGNAVKALQFHIVVRDSALILRSISKGSDIASSAYSLSSKISRAATREDGSSNDTIKVVIYGTGSNALVAGTYKSLVTFEYDAVNISSPESLYSSLVLSDVFASQANGDNAGVLAGANQVVEVVNRSIRGDINNDDRVDILDLLLIVDHILGKSALAGDAFARADIYPWPAGDSVINVQDLALLQNIVLSGQYPDGTNVTTGKVTAKPVVAASALSKTSGAITGYDAQVTFYLTSSGIAVRLANAVAVKGIQIDLDGVSSIPSSMTISTTLGAGYYKLNNTTLRVLVYDQAGATLEAGERIIANLPFTLSKPTDVTISNVVVAGSDDKEVSNVQVSKSYDSAPELPSTYSLSQNFPNPFNPSTTINFTVPQSSFTRIVVYNMLGQVVRNLFEGQMEQGTKAIVFDGHDNTGHALATGTYFYRMTSGSFTQTRKMLLLK